MRDLRTRRVPLGNLGQGMRCPYILAPYVESGEQARRSNGGPVAHFDRRLAGMRARLLLES